MGTARLTIPPGGEGAANATFELSEKPGTQGLSAWAVR
jgi:hypothetical protein